MNIPIAVISVILVLICIVPFLYVGRSRKDKEKKMLQSLLDFAHQFNGQISHQDIWGEIMIGLDEIKSQLFFMKQLHGEVIKQHIDLKEIQICKIKNSSRSINNSTIIEKLELLLIPKDKNKKERSLEFFNNDHSNQIVDELKLIEKWNILINEELKKQ